MLLPRITRRPVGQRIIMFGDSSLRPHKWVLSEKNSAVLLLNGCLALTASLFVLYARRIFPAGRRFGVSNSGELTVSQRIPSFGIEKRSEEHTSELQSLMRISYDVFCLKKKTEPKL